MLFDEGMRAPIHPWSTKNLQHPTDLPPTHHIVCDLMGTRNSVFLVFPRTILLSRATFAMQNASLRQRLAVWQRTRKRV